MRSSFLFLSFLLLLLTAGARAEPLSMIKVGDFGGIRVKAPCFFGLAARLCTVDTMGSVSVVTARNPFLHYPVTGHEDVEGIGISLSCDVVDITDFSMLGYRPARLRPLRCELEHSSFPLIGLPFFEGLAFQFNFPAADFTWGALRGARQPLRRINGAKSWLALPGSFGGGPALLAFDTGNPVTMVSRAFVEAHPTSFRASSKPISPGLFEKGLRPFEVLAPFVVNGVALRAEFVYASSGALDSFFTEAPVILGMNHIAQARWGFDLRTDEFQVSR